MEAETSHPEATTAAEQVLATTADNFGAATADETTHPYSMLCSLPVELLIRIIRLLCTKDRIRCIQVCKRFYNIFHETPIGAYAVEQDLTHVRNGPTQTFSTADRLQRLRDYREAWKSLQWQRETVLDLKPDTILRLHGSVLGRCDIDTKGGRFEFMQVPSPNRNIPQREWSVALPDMEPVDFEIDAVQNLLVIMERLPGKRENDPGSLRLHFLTLDSGARHPEASEPYTDIHAQHPLGHEWYIHQSNICDEYIGLMLEDEGDEDHSEFWAWNWKKGAMVMNLHSAYHDIAEGFIFLSPGMLLLPMVVPAAESLHGTYGCLVALDCAVPFPDRKTYATAMKESSTATFLLPEPAPGNFYERILMAGSGCSSQPPYPNPHSLLNNDVPFFADTRTRLFVFDITVMEHGTRGVRGHTLLVPSNALERRVRMSEERGGHSLYQWHSWVKETRLTTAVLMQSHTSVFQRRCVAPEFTSEDGDGRVVALYEINSTLAMRRDIARAPETGSQYVFEPYVDTDMDAWMDHVQTKMPYRKFVTTIDAGKNGDLHLGEDCLIIRDQETHKCRILSF